MKIGYLGVGTIASCMIEGFCGLDGGHEFFLSPRSESRAAALAAKYKNVRHCRTNQEVADNADAVFVTVLPNACLPLLESLTFRPDQMIVNVTATIALDRIQAAVGQVKSLSHIVPLPFIARRIGPIAVYRETAELAELLSPLGTLVAAKEIDEVKAMQAVTALMSSFYELLHLLNKFSESEGMSADDAVKYNTSFFAAMCSRAAGFSKTEGGSDLHELALEMTPGGLNELALTSLGRSGAIKAWADVMLPVMDRLRPKSAE